MKRRRPLTYPQMDEVYLAARQMYGRTHFIYRGGHHVAVCRHDLEPGNTLPRRLLLLADDGTHDDPPTP